MPINRAIEQKYGWVWPASMLVLIWTVLSGLNGMTAYMIGMLAAISLSGSV